MRCVLITFLASLSLSAQVAIQPSGIVNAASYSTTVAPGSVAAVFGTFPVGAPSAAFTIPLPISLAQLSFQFGGGPLAPLFFVSPAQANIQVPWELMNQAQVSLTPIYASQIGIAQTVTLAKFAPGIFAMNRQGTGQGAIEDRS